MRFKAFLLVLFFVFTIIGGINAKWRSSGRSSGGSRSGSYGSSHRTSSHQSTNAGSSRGSYGSSPSHTSISHVPTSSAGHRPSGHETQSRPNPVSHPIGSSPGPVTPQHSKDINTHFLSAEGGGARRPVQTDAAGTSFGTSYPPVSTQNKPTAPAIQPTAPKEQVIRPTGTYQNQGSNAPYIPGHSTTGQTRPPWSNPHLGTHRSNSSSQTNTPWSNPHMGTQRSNSSSQTHTPYGNGSPSSVPSPTNYPYNPSSPVNPIAPSGYQPPQIGFKDHVYPQNHPTSMNSPYGQPQMGGHYPHSAPPPSGPWPTHSYPPPNYHPSGMPMGNPYSLHPSGGAYHAPGQANYPQQPQVLAQPASQPFIPGQTVIMVPGQQDSGRGFGQLVKEALVFSTINAGVNRLINPHTHYTPSTSDSSSSSQPAATTHVTYNNQYFNTPPATNGAPNPIPNAGAGNMPSSSLGYGNTYPTSSPNGGVSSPVTGTGNGGGGNIGTVNGGGGNIGTGQSGNIGTGQTGNIGTGQTGNVAPPSTAQTNAASNQGNLSNNSNTVANIPFYKISDNDLFTISEDLFSKSLDVSKYIKLNLQKRSTSSNITDEAKEPLLAVEPELMHYPSIYVTRALYDMYGHEFRKKVNRTLQIREDENLLIDTFLNTNVMGRAMQWLADRGFIDPDDFERKDVLRRIWFTMFSGSTCGFERVFASENYDVDIVGVQDWIYFETEESKKHINYMSYVDELKFGNKASLLKLNFDMDGVVRPNATIFVGTMPELEMSLYTICFFARQNNLCPVSFGGTKFNIYTHSFTYFGNEIIDLAFPTF